MKYGTIKWKMQSSNFYRENNACPHTVCTRPFLLLKGPGCEAKNQLYSITLRIKAKKSTPGEKRRRERGSKGGREGDRERRGEVGGTN